LRAWYSPDAGRLVEEGAPLEALAEELQARVLAAASGEYQARNEANGYREIALFKDGVMT
jgi:altronate hydrolase